MKGKSQLAFSGSVRVGDATYPVSGLSWVADTWRSPHSGATYPARWTVTVPTADLILELTPFLADQELNDSYTYWEGAVRVEGTHAGQPVSGDGYVELTGYAASMQNQF